MPEWAKAMLEVTQALGVVGGIFGFGLKYLAELRIIREAVVRMEKWVREHEEVLDDHGTRLARVEGLVWGNSDPRVRKNGG